jgi:hypothetical protein
MLILLRGTTGIGAITPPSGWTLMSGSFGNGTDGDGVYWKTAVGGEVSATFTYAVGGSRLTWAEAMAFNGASAVDPYAYVSQTSVAQIDCPSITASWGSDDNLFLAIGYWSDVANGDAPTNYPTNYNLMRSTQAGAEFVGYTTSARQLAAATDNPSNMIASGNIDTAIGLTFVLRPGTTSMVAVARGASIMG